MKAVCIIGSPWEQGSTACLVDSLIRGLRENGTQVKRYCLGKCDIRYCLGCKKCYESGICVQNDDVTGIVEDIFDADLVVIASPSYWGDITGQLKVFFDRNTPYGDTNPNRITPVKQRRGIAISVRAGSTERENTHILEAIEHYFGHLGIEPVGRLSVCNVDTLQDLLKDHADQVEAAYQMGKAACR